MYFNDCWLLPQYGLCVVVDAEDAVVYRISLVYLQLFHFYDIILSRIHFYFVDAETLTKIAVNPSQL